MKQTQSETSYNNNALIRNLDASNRDFKANKLIYEKAAKIHMTPNPKQIKNIFKALSHNPKFSSKLVGIISKQAMKRKDPQAIL